MQQPRARLWLRVLLAVVSSGSLVKWYDTWQTGRADYERALAKRVDTYAARVSDLEEKNLTLCEANTQLLMERVDAYRYVAELTARVKKLEEKKP